jgi:hypothetical protein
MSEVRRGELRDGVGRDLVVVVDGVDRGIEGDEEVLLLGREEVEEGGEGDVVVEIEVDGEKGEDEGEGKEVGFFVIFLYQYRRLFV